MGTPTVEDAMRYIVSGLRGQLGIPVAKYGYDLYLHDVMYRYLSQSGKAPHPTGFSNDESAEVSPPFYAAAWELCRRGVLRPGVRRFGVQVVDDGSGGAGFSIMPAGQSWLDKGGQDDFFVIDPERYANLLTPFAKRLGAGFQQRGQEASRCYFAHAYLACCAMCGAAAESVLLSAAIAKNGSEDAILKTYRAASGRKRVQDGLTGGARKELSQPFATMMGLLSYWRDDAAHGSLSPITELEAHEAMTRLLRLANFFNDNWKELTGKA